MDRPRKLRTPGEYQNAMWALQNFDWTPEEEKELLRLTEEWRSLFLKDVLARYREANRDP